MCRAMGFLMNEKQVLVVSDDSDKTDYGYGRGAAILARNAWLGARPGDKGFERASVVGTILVSLATRGMATWAVELGSYLTHKSICIMDTIHNHSTVYMTEGEMLDMVKHMAVPLAGRSPIYMHYLKRCRSIIEALPEEIKKCEPSQQEKNTYWCECGTSWVFITMLNAKEKRIYSLCPIELITGKGCSKWSRVILK
jgi:hypothetical protein